MTSKAIIRSLLLLIFPVLASLGSAQPIGLPNQTWSAELIRDNGQPVIPLLDGWYPNADGSKTICFGFFNMNKQEALDIPLGEGNFLETDYPGLDLSGVMLPTHFDPLPPRYRHVFCAFTVTVPDDFGLNHRVTWRLSSHDQDLSTPGKVLPAYVMDEPDSHGRGDRAPAVRLSADGQAVRGRTGIQSSRAIAARVDQAVTLSAWIDHPEAEVWVGWSHHSGPGEVSFDQKEYEIPSATATQVQASFSEPGQYVVRMQTIDSIAAFEFYCCHTNAYYHINVSN